MKDTSKQDSSSVAEQAAAAAAESHPRPSLGVAYLYKSTDATKRWTHSMPWKANVLTELKRCPASGEPVAMICDGMAAAAALQQTETSDDAKNAEGTIVRFRFGKKTFQLSTIRGPDDPIPNEPMSGYSGLRWPLSLFGRIFGPAHVVPSGPVAMLAEDRIANALDLAWFKILYKGSLLYDGPAKGGTRTINTPPDPEEMVSVAILKVSDEDWKAAGDKKKATLVVMGTSREHRLVEPSRDATAGNNVDSFVRQSIRIPVKLVWWSAKLTWGLVASFFGPFLPAHWVPRALDDDDGSSARPHRD